MIFFDSLKNDEFISSRTDFYQSILAEEQILLIQNRFDEQYVQRKMAEMYSFVKTVAPAYSLEGQMHPMYSVLENELHMSEDFIPAFYILQSEPDFTYDPRFKPSSSFHSFSSFEDVLSYLVLWERQRIALQNSRNLRKKYPHLENLSLENQCKKVSRDFKKLCDSFHISCFVVPIYPAFTNVPQLYENGSGYHYFNLVINGKNSYLVDCTYRQFFQLKDCMLERIGVPGYCSCLPGAFMNLNEESRKIAQIILKQGWISLTCDIFKTYLDGFTFSYRNGLYYDELGEFDYSVSYTVEQYIKFLFGEDNLFCHERKEALGKQKTLMRVLERNFDQKRVSDVKKKRI